MRRRAGLLVLLFLLPLEAVADDRVEFVADLVARSFFRALVDGDAAALAPLCGRRVNFDGEWAEGEAAIGKQLRLVAGRAKRKGLKLRKLVVWTSDEAVRRLGPPPARIRPSLGPRTVVALGAFERGGAVVVLARERGFYRVVAVTD